MQVERIVISIRRELISFVTPPNTEYTFSQLAVNIIWYCRLKIAISLYKQDKIREGQIPLDEKENYEQLRSPMALETSQKAEEIIKVLHHEDHIDDMTNKWLSQTPNPPRIPVFYTLTKIHKPNPVGRPIISGCEGPTERISSFVNHLLEPIA